MNFEEDAVLLVDARLHPEDHAGLEELGRGRGDVVDGGGDVIAEPVTDDRLRLLAFQCQQLRRRQGAQAVAGTQCVKHDSDIGLEQIEEQAGRSGCAETLGTNNGIAALKDPGPVKSVGLAVLQAHLEDARLDQDLLRLEIKLCQQRLELGMEVRCILDDQHAPLRQRGYLPVGGEVLLDNIGYHLGIRILHLIGTHHGRPARLRLAGLLAIDDEVGTATSLHGITGRGGNGTNGPVDTHVKQVDRDLAVDVQGNARVAGYSLSGDFPSTVGLTGPAMFVAQLNAEGAEFDYVVGIDAAGSTNAGHGIALGTLGETTFATGAKNVPAEIYVTNLTDPMMLFCDGFETGTETAWSSP